MCAAEGRGIAFLYHLMSCPSPKRTLARKLIDPAIHQRGWSEDMICRETTLGAVEIIAKTETPRSSSATIRSTTSRTSSSTSAIAPRGENGLSSSPAIRTAAQTNFDYRTSATQVLFLQHVIRALKDGGRCSQAVTRETKSLHHRARRRACRGMNILCGLRGLGGDRCGSPGYLPRPNRPLRGASWLAPRAARTRTPA